MVNAQAAGQCAEIEVSKHSCCCSANGGCDDDMSCCVGENDDESPNYSHASTAPLELQKLFIEEPKTNFKTQERVIELVDFTLKSNPPPRQKVYLTIHKLIYYA